eukprot:gb/GECG01002945.1/.p1 GENE.gb/GECG01002945.1/~~gb/GECG01002945.1/.p1  ORF type:complete len:791 (+),score=65.54 gb/GECG01002945.1/:1-2373(+)
MLKKAGEQCNRASPRFLRRITCLLQSAQKSHQPPWRSGVWRKLYDGRTSTLYPEPTWKFVGSSTSRRFSAQHEFVQRVYNTTKLRYSTDARECGNAELESNSTVSFERNQCKVETAKANRRGDDSRLISVLSGGTTVQGTLDVAAKTLKDSQNLYHGPHYRLNSFAVFQYVVKGEQGNNIEGEAELSHGDFEAYFNTPLLGVCVKHLRGASAPARDFPVQGKLTFVTLPNDVTVEPFTSLICELPPLRNYGQLLNQSQLDRQTRQCPLTFWLFSNYDIVPSELHAYMDRIEKIFPNTYVAGNISHKPKAATIAKSLGRTSRGKGTISPLRVDKCDVVGIAVQGDLDNAFYLKLTRSIYGDSSDKVYMGKNLENDLHHSLHKYVGCAIQSTPSVVERWWPHSSAVRFEGNQSSKYKPNPFVSEKLASMYEQFDISNTSKPPREVPEKLRVDQLLAANTCFDTMNMFSFNPTSSGNMHYIVPGERVIFRMKDPRTKYMLYRYFENGEPIVVSPTAEDTHSASFGEVLPRSSSSQARLMEHREKERTFQAEPEPNTTSAKWGKDFPELQRALVDAQLALRDLDDFASIDRETDTSGLPAWSAVGTLAVVRTLFNRESDGRYVPHTRIVLLRTLCRLLRHSCSMMVELEGVRRVYLNEVWTVEGGFGLQQASGKWYDDIFPEQSAEEIVDMLKRLEEATECPYTTAQSDLRRWASHPNRLFQRTLTINTHTSSVSAEALSWWLAEILPVAPRTKLQYLRLRSSRHRLALQLSEILKRAYKQEVSGRDSDPIRSA